MENKTFITADAERNIPVTEPERQYYFIEKAKEKLTKLKEEEKREFTFCVTTFGCQMNARDSEKLCGILEKIGVQRTVLKQSVRKEICFTYYCPFVLTCLTSYFSVKALGNVMQEELFRVNLWSAGIIFLVFTCICFFSVREAWKRLFD